MKAIVLCAGKGTRIAAVSGGVPKPLLPVGGQPVVARTLRWLGENGLVDIHINLHYQPETVMDVLGDGARWGVKITYTLEQEILGTFGGVKNIAHAWIEPFLVVYGDNVYEFSLPSFLAAHKGLALVALFDRTRAAHTGIAGGQAVVADGKIVRFVEGSKDFVSPYVNAGVYVLDPLIFSQVREGPDFGRDVFPLLLQQQETLYGHVVDGNCYGIDTPECYKKTKELSCNNKNTTKKQQNSTNSRTH